MSDGIEKCSKYTQVIGPCGETVEIERTECGVDLEGIPYEGQTVALLDAARGTGTSAVLSLADALKKALVDDIVDRRDKRGYRADCLDASDYRLSPCCRDPEMCDRSVAEDKVDKTGLELMLKSLPEEKRAAIQQRAQAFLDNARALVEKLRAPVEKPVPKERPEYLRGRIQ